ncbi:MAG: hypothetical protein JST26_11745 [Bacteroidetes bacterium]|nr:hypothetical protein [Bacteroidota bacterium]
MISANDYYAFGAPMMGRTYQGNVYRYGFNGKEKDDEIKGVGSSIAYELRIYDPRLGRFLSVDPLRKEYPWQTPYAYFSNSPVGTVDFLGGGGKDKGKQNETKLGGDGYSVINATEGTKHGNMLVLPSSYASDKTLMTDYNAAIEAKVPIMLVDDIKGFEKGLEFLALKDIKVNAFTLSNHSSAGHFKIGKTVMYHNSDFTSLGKGLKGKLVFIAQCEVTRGSNPWGIKAISKMASETGAAVVSSNHRVNAGYRFDGSDELNGGKGHVGVGRTDDFPYFEIRTEGSEGTDYNDYILAQPGQPAIKIYDFKINERGVFYWNKTDDGMNVKRSPDMQGN